MKTYPHIQVEGNATERGRQYGAQARTFIEKSVAAYREVFQYYAGWDWSDVRSFAAGYEGPIGAFSPKYLEELRAMAQGSGFDLLDILAINVRTEIMYSARARQVSIAQPHECTSFGIIPATGSSQQVIVGQNWDWLPHTFDTVVVLEARQDDGPNYVTVVEAGLLAKTGMNANGIGLVTNALATDADVGEPGVPYHVFLRAILDSETVTGALTLLQQSSRSSSANYLVAHRDGSGLDVEVAPGDFSRLFVLIPEDGLLLHTNHFVSPRFDGRDVSLWTSPDSPIRYSRLISGLRIGSPTVESLQTLLSDHANHPYGVCSHPDPRVKAVEQGATIASVIMDLEGQTMWLADGPPCSTAYRQLDYRNLFATGSQ
jgi:isopenicillin-N N-acyltransferase-like protein